MQHSRLQRRAAVEGYPCPTCHRMPGFRCHDLSNRPVTAHRLRVQLALADAERVGSCGERSPDGSHLCALPDLASWHLQGQHRFLSSSR